MTASKSFPLPLLVASGNTQVGSRMPLRRLLSPCVAFAALTCASACDSASSDAASGTSTAATNGSVEGVTQESVLQNIVSKVLTPTTAAFADQANRLQEAIATWDAANGMGETEQAAVREVFLDAMTSWQQLEVMQLGPLASSLAGIAGEDIRDAVYSWPTADTCRIDRNIAERAYTETDFFVTQLVWAYGLDALEYLLFATSTAHSCPPQVQLDGPWSELGDDGIWQRRAEYAHVLAQEIVRHANDVKSRWSSEGVFASHLSRPGEGDSPYANADTALNEVFRAMFYVYTITGHRKLETPLGLREGCSAPPCIELFELPHSGASTQAIVANLQGVKHLVQGGSSAGGVGLDALLVEIGASSVATDLHEALDAAIAFAQELDGSLQTVANDDVQQLTILRDRTKTVGDILKGPLVMALRLTVPQEAAGDND